MIPNLRRRSRLLLGRCRVVNWRRLVRNLGRWCMLRRRGIAHGLPSLWWRLGLRRRRIVHSLSGLRRRLRLRWRRIELRLVRWRRSRRRRILAMLLLLLRSWGTLCRAGRRRVVVARHDFTITCTEKFNKRRALVIQDKDEDGKGENKKKDETLKELSPG